ncbi:MAG: Flp family type IVb pilin [Amaricoccus sp.]|uniref:Flp family type IVb pilin n=1 Tax=Amaricoccus sp. TaxID=1872485 RepID=UPI0039E26F52
MASLWTLWQRCLRDTRGATAIEYALLAGLLAGAILVTVGTTGRTFASFFASTSDTLQAEIAKSAAP